MCRRLLPLLVLAAGLIAAAMLHGGLYVAVPSSGQDEHAVFRMNRWTGRLDVCRRDRDDGYAIACAPAWEARSQY